tara:strand:+ start:1137 stop:1835 length:699 start_codon:yes stop_codon:yes gene_type:complete
MSTKYNLNIVTDGLVLCLDAANKKSYPGTGTTWTDRSGNGNNGTLVNGPTLDSDSGGSFSFDQTNDHVNTYKNGSELNLLEDSFSIEIAIKQNESAPTSNSQGHAGFGGFPSAISLKSTSRFFADIHNPSDTRTIVDFHSSSFYSANQYNWMILCVTINNETVKTYTNGNYYTSATISSGLQSFQSDDFTVANGYGYYRSHSNIAYVKMYNKPLTAAEVLQNYNATKSRFGL